MGGGGCCRRLQGKNIENEIEFEAHTGEYRGGEERGEAYTGGGI